MTKLLGSILLVLVLSSCGGHTLQSPPASSAPLAATHPVLVVRGKLPSTVQYETVGPIVVRKTSYGSADWALDRLADEARKTGANAVIDVQISFAPSWVGWATPHGKGTAVRILKPPAEQAASMPNV